MSIKSKWRPLNLSLSYNILLQAKKIRLIVAPIISTTDHGDYSYRLHNGTDFTHTGTYTNRVHLFLCFSYVAFGYVK